MLIMGFTSDEWPWISSSLLFILWRAKHNNFYWHSFPSFVDYKLGFIWDIFPISFYNDKIFSLLRFFAIIARARPFLGLGKIIWSPGEVPNILFLINYLSLRKVPFAPVISDSRKINLPLILLWSNIFSIKYMILSKAN